MALKVGLILYSVREEMAKDPIATVEKVGKLGYRFIEIWVSCHQHPHFSFGEGRFKRGCGL